MRDLRATPARRLRIFDNRKTGMGALAATVVLALTLAAGCVSAETKRAVATYQATALGMSRNVAAGATTREQEQAFIAKEAAAWEAVKKALE